MPKREFEITLKFGNAKFSTKVTGLGDLLTTLEKTMAELGHDSSGILDTILELATYLDDPAPIDFVAADAIYIKADGVVEEVG